MLALVGSGEYLPPIASVDRDSLDGSPRRYAWSACPRQPARKATRASITGLALASIISPASAFKHSLSA